MDLLVWGPWVFYLCGANPVRDEKAEGEAFLPIFSGIIIFTLELYLGDQLCSKCTKKSFVSYSVNEI